jgi:hypothetical protein
MVSTSLFTTRLKPGVNEKLKQVALRLKGVILIAYRLTLTAKLMVVVGSALLVTSCPGGLFRDREAKHFAVLFFSPRGTKLFIESATYKPESSGRAKSSRHFGATALLWS